MLQFLIGCGGGNEEAVTVAGRETTDYSGACYCGMADRDDVCELSLEDTVGVLVGVLGLKSEIRRK